MAQEADPLDSLLSLEDQYYTEGHTLGLADGARAGRMEGRLFGLQKGFEKHLELGRLSGRAAVWQARTQLIDGGDPSNASIVPLESSERLKRHVTRLGELTDASTLSTENSEDAVEEFEGRLRDAKAKAVLISNLRAVGETDRGKETEAGSADGGLKVRKPAARGEMEDFAGSVPIVKSKGKAETTG